MLANVSEQTTNLRAEDSLGGEVVPEAAKRGHDLVSDEHDVVLRADLLESGGFRGPAGGDGLKFERVRVCWGEQTC